MASGDSPHDDDTLTLRFPRPAVAAVIALVAHVVTAVLLGQIPDPTPKVERIELTMQSPKPPPPPSTASPAPPSPKKPEPDKTKPKPKTAQPPQTSPVRPELPPSEKPPENRAVLPVVEQSPVPAPPPQPSTWQERLAQSLATPPPTQAPSGVLAPSFGTLDRVAFNDARLHDEENEERIAADFGPFFRRGIEALRSQWHPEVVLRTRDPVDPSKLCGAQRRTTFGVATIDKTGKVIDVEVNTPSGCPQLDDEAVAAFKRVAKFPHPPAGLFVNPDGTPAETARWPVRFIVDFRQGLRLDW